MKRGLDYYLIEPADEVAIGQALEMLVRTKRLQDELRETQKKLAEVTAVDGLTGLSDRRHFFRTLESEIERTSRYHLPLAVFMIDIDDFKLVNDRLGHIYGDDVLRELGGILRNNLRRMDTVARYGGEEFAAILPNTALAEATTVAERLRGKVEKSGFGEEGVNITVSIGVAIYWGESRITPEELMKQADMALYDAKSRGKNLAAAYREKIKEV